MRLILIDEIHRLNPRTTTGAETADRLKDLTELIRSTFVYAGIDVTTTALLSRVRGAQLAGRASLVECGAFPARLGKHEPFRELITGVEAALDLRAHQTGTLPRHSAYLHQRTAGRIGSLTRLIRQAAITAISDGTERITKNQPRSDPLGPPRRNPPPPHPEPAHHTPPVTPRTVRRPHGTQRYGQGKHTPAFRRQDHTRDTEKLSTKTGEPHASRPTGQQDRAHTISTKPGCPQHTTTPAPQLHPHETTPWNHTTARRVSLPATAPGPHAARRRRRSTMIKACAAVLL